MDDQCNQTPAGEASTLTSLSSLYQEPRLSAPLLPESAFASGEDADDLSLPSCPSEKFDCIPDMVSSGSRISASTGKRDSSGFCMVGGEQTHHGIQTDRRASKSYSSQPALASGHAVSVWSRQLNRAVEIEARNLAFGLTRKIGLNLPWETGPLRSVFNPPDRIEPYPTSRLGLQEVLGQVSLPKTQQPRALPAITGHLARRRVWLSKVHKTDDELRTAALTKMRTLVLYDVQSSKLGKQLLTLGGSLVEESVIRSTFQDAMAVKATATLVKRSAAIWSFATWALSDGFESPLRATELLVYKYMCHLRESKAAPTKATVFLESWRFIHAAAQLEFAIPAELPSARVVGAAKAMALKKRVLKQAAPLSASMVEALEDIVLNGGITHERIIAGFFILVLFSVSRFSDCMYLESLTFEKHEGLVLMHGATTQHKTSITVQQKLTLLPIVALGCGLSKKAWAPVWMDLREWQGHHELSHVLPAFSDTSFSWLKRPMTSAEASCWLRQLLMEKGFTRAQTDGVSTHSLKSCLLSWVAKAGILTPAERRVLGHHVDPHERSRLTYARDSYVELQAKIWPMLMDIRRGKFNPDLPAVQRLASLLPKGFRLPTGEDDLSSEGDFDVKPEDVEISANQFSGVCRKLQLESPQLPDFGGALVMMHCISEIVHTRRGPDSDLFKCGRKISGNFIPLGDVVEDFHML